MKKRLSYLAVLISSFIFGKAGIAQQVDLYYGVEPWPKVSNVAAQNTGGFSLGKIVDSIKSPIGALSVGAVFVIGLLVFLIRHRKQNVK